MRVVLSEASKRDLWEIGDYIAKDSRSAAARFVSRLEQACRDLSTLSHRYPLDPITGLRKRPIDAYVIFYGVTDHVRIARILHAARDSKAFLSNG